MTYPGQDHQHVDDFFGGGSKSISFDADKGYQLGTWKGGTILSIRPKQQQTDIKTKAPLTWDDGQPKWTLPVEMQTDERDPQTPHDDGKRTLFVSGGIERALREHLRATNAKLRPGGVLWAAWVSGAGKIGDAKQYQVHYTPAAETAADQMLGGAPQGGQPASQWAGQQPQPYAQPAPNPYGQPAPQPPYGQPAAPAAPPAPPAPQQPTQAGPPANPGFWNEGAPPQAPAQQWPAPGQVPAQPGPPAPPAGPQQPAPPAAAQQPQPVAQGVVDPAAIDAAWSHLTADQRAAIKASGMAWEQIASVYGPPQQPANA